MSEWTLPAKEGENFSDLVHDFENSGKIDKSRQFLRGGMWRNFQNIYDESNWMQKRVSDLSFIFEKNKQIFFMVNKNFRGKKPKNMDFLGILMIFWPPHKTHRNQTPQQPRQAGDRSRQFNKIECYRGGLTPGLPG